MGSCDVADLAIVTVDSLVDLVLLRVNVLNWIAPKQLYSTSVGAYCQTHEIAIVHGLDLADIVDL
jgi:hypothetical protein